MQRENTINGDTSWNHKRIGQLGEIFTGRTPSTKHPEYFGDEYHFITPGDMHQGRYVLTTQRGLSSNGAHLLKRIQLPTNSVCVSCIGWQMGEVVMTSELSFTNQQINSVVPNAKVVDPFFLYYSLLPRKQELLLLGSAIGVRTPILNKSGFCNLKVLMPPLPTQRKIAAILSAYDDLIENNNRRIKILEEMARLIHREWFVNFRFPGHEKVKMVNSPLGKIPEGWNVSTISETFSILGGGTPSKSVPEYWENGSINWYIPSDLTSSSSMFSDQSGTQINNLGLQKSSAKLFPPFSAMMTSRATIGVISINTTEACTNQGFITCIPNDHFPLYFMYHWLTDNVEKFIGLGTGATFKEITKGVFKTIEVIVPPEHMTSMFEKTIEPIGHQILNLSRQNKNLRQTRDLLLPKLISGELDVSDLDIKTKSVEV